MKNQIEEQITARLAPYNIVVDALSITEFAFSQQFTTAVEAKVEAQQRALQAQNELRRIQIEAQQMRHKQLGNKRLTSLEPKESSKLMSCRQREKHKL